MDFGWHRGVDGVVEGKVNGDRVKEDIGGWGEILTLREE